MKLPIRESNMFKHVEDSLASSQTDYNPFSDVDDSAESGSDMFPQDIITSR